MNILTSLRNALQPGIALKSIEFQQGSQNKLNLGERGCGKLPAVLNNQVLLQVQLQIRNRLLPACLLRKYLSHTGYTMYNLQVGSKIQSLLNHIFCC